MFCFAGKCKSSKEVKNKRMGAVAFLLFFYLFLTFILWSDSGFAVERDAHAGGLEGGAELGDVVVVAGFDGEEDADQRDVGGAELAVVADFLDGAAVVGDDVEHARQSAGAVGDVGDDGGESAVGSQAAVDHAGDHGDVDVSATEDEDDFFAFEVGEAQGVALHHGGEADGAGAFDDHFFEFEQAEDGLGDGGFIDEHGLIDDFPGEIEADFPDLRDGQAIGECGLGVAAG